MFQSVDELIEALGGTHKVAVWLDVGDTCVSNWRTKRKIPAGWWPDFAEALPGRVPRGLFTFRPKSSAAAEPAA